MTRPSNALIIAKCACGKSYTIREWERLERRGDMDSGVKGVRLELRDCACRSTISAEMCGATYAIGLT